MVRTIQYFGASLLLASFCASALASSPVDFHNIHSWKDLPEDKTFKHPHDLHYFQLKTENGTGVFLAVAEFGKHHLLVKPVVNTGKGGTTSAAAKASQCLAAVNGGFFNLSNGESASYVTIDGKLECNAALNKALTGNEKLKPFLPAIFNRSELRITSGSDHELHPRICAHNDALEKGETLVDSLQAGPRLLPALTDEKEAFVRTESDGKIVDSIGVKKTAARTAFGIADGDKTVMLICVAGKRQDEFSAGVTLAELASMLKALGCTEALNFDGGTSTTMVVKDESAPGTYKMVCGRNPETFVKTTFAIYKP